VASIDPDLLLRAYAIGVFPMSDSREAREVYWVEPRRRAILPLDDFHLSRSLRKTLRSGRFTVTRDRAFAEVISRCAARGETWINKGIEDGYLRAPRARLRPFDRDVGEWRAGRRSLRRAPGQRLFRRKHVLHRH
jgi:leucyl/phenylalanyl-tRNA--protein transferase